MPAEIPALAVPKRHERWPDSRHLRERIGASGDFFFSVRDGKDPKKDISGEQDDDNDTLHPFGFYSRTSDPGAYQFTAPDDGKYYVAIGCRDSNTVAGPSMGHVTRRKRSKGPSAPSIAAAS